MTIAYKVFGDDNFGSVQYGDNFKSFEEAEEYIKSHDWKGNPPFIIAKRIPERGFPKTSLTGDELYDIYSNSDASTFREELIDVANAAIKQYILDSEDGCRIDTEA